MCSYSEMPVISICKNVVTGICKSIIYITIIHVLLALFEGVMRPSFRAKTITII